MALITQVPEPHLPDMMDTTELKDYRLLVPVRNISFHDYNPDISKFNNWEGSYATYYASCSTEVTHGKRAIVLQKGNDTAYMDNIELLSYVPYEFRFQMASKGAFTLKVIITCYREDGREVSGQVVLESLETGWKYNSIGNDMWKQYTSQAGSINIEDILRFKKDSNSYHVNSIRLKFQFTSPSGDIKLNDVMLYAVISPEQVSSTITMNSPTLYTPV